MSNHKNKTNVLNEVLNDSFFLFDDLLEKHRFRMKPIETGRVWKIGNGIARIKGLPNVRNEELIRFSGGEMGMAFNLDMDEISAVLIDDYQGIKAGQPAWRTHRIMDVPVGDELVGRVLDALGRPLDGKGQVKTYARFPVERPAPAIIDRAPVETPLQTGIKAIDALIPIGRGQRELILGDRQIGKTAVAID
ncbi:MAG TPA: F0F1 ATP synthase subunit alpha, partial [bacterium]|nr:F0F1 ATP synthase subunit alpha [bacterium]